MVMPNTGEFPMPFFIKLDDVEYGLRGQDYAIMNRFGVWHEAFGNKGNAWTEYYTTRNALIIQSMYPELGHSAVNTMGMRLLKALAYGEPKCMEAALKGVEDYLEEPEEFIKMNPEERHCEVMALYGARLAADMNRKRMLKRAVKNITRKDAWRSIRLLVRGIRLLRKKRGHDPVWASLCTREFWEKYLGLSE